jgi:hypothetical protein
MRSRLAALVATAATALALALGGAVAPASAAPDTVLLSLDGTTFTPTLSSGLFDGAGMLVPGQSVSRSLWIRNPTASVSALRVSIRNLVSTSTAFADGVSLSSVDSLPGSSPVSHALSGLGACEVLSSAPSVASGDTVKLTLTFTMADLTQTVAQTDRASLDLMVAMRDGSAGAFSGPACRDVGTLLADTGTFRTVAFTGGSLPVPLIVGGGVLLGVGMCLIVARRRRQSEDD